MERGSYLYPEQSPRGRRGRNFTALDQTCLAGRLGFTTHRWIGFPPTPLIGYHGITAGGLSRRRGRGPARRNAQARRFCRRSAVAAKRFGKNESRYRHF